MDIGLFKHTGFVTPVSRHIQKGVRTHFDDVPIDVPKAIAEWEGAGQVLRDRLGMNIVNTGAVEIPGEVNATLIDINYDCVFGKDPFAAGVDAEGKPFFIQGRMIDRRQPEVYFQRKRLSVLYPDVPWLEVTKRKKKAHFERGDIVKAGGNRLFLGLSERTNKWGVAAVKWFLTRRGFDVKVIPVNKAIHLDMVLSTLAEGVYLVNKKCVSPQDVANTKWGDVVVAEDDEAAFVPGIWDSNGRGPQRVQRPCERIRKIAESLDTTVHEVSYNELHKAESGPPCIVNDVLTVD